MPTPEIYICFCPFLGFLFVNNQGNSVDSDWNVRVCMQLCIPFNFTIVPLSNCIFLKVYSRFKYLSGVLTSLL